MQKQRRRPTVKVFEILPYFGWSMSCKGNFLSIKDPTTFQSSLHPNLDMSRSLNLATGCRGSLGPGRRRSSAGCCILAAGHAHHLRWTLSFCFNLAYCTFEWLTMLPAGRLPHTCTVWGAPLSKRETSGPRWPDVGRSDGTWAPPVS